MTGASLRATVADAREAELDELASPALLAALTGGDPSPEGVLAVAAASERAARETFAGWVVDERDPGLRAAFAAVAERETDHYDRVVSELGSEPPTSDAPGPMHAYLRGRADPLDRVAGGMVGRALVTLRTHDALIAFFERERPGTAALFRSLRADTEDTVARGERLLDRRCRTDGARERAREVAAYAVTLAYDDYADALRAAGGDPGG